MREWVTRVMTAAVLSALLELLAPEGRMRRYVSFGIAAVLLALLLSPLGGLSEGLHTLPPLPGFDGLTEGSTDAAEEAVLALAEAALDEHLSERFSLPEAKVRSKLTYSEDKSVLHLSLALPRGAPIEEIRAYLTAKTALECEVIICES